jgi:hypothetical protein
MTLHFKIRTSIRSSGRRIVRPRHRQIWIVGGKIGSPRSPSLVEAVPQSPLEKLSALPLFPVIAIEGVSFVAYLPGKELSQHV